MSMEEMKDKTKAAFEAATDATDKDAVCMAMFQSGVDFSKLNTLYKTVGIAEGYLVDPAVVKEGVQDFLEDYEIDLQSWSDVEGVISDILDKVDGCTGTVAMRIIRAHCKDNDIDFPKKAKASKGPRGRGGKVAIAMVDYFTEADEVTPAGMYEVVLPLVKGPVNAEWNVKTFFAPFYAVKEGMSLKQANKEIKDLASIPKSE